MNQLQQELELLCDCIQKRTITSDTDIPQDNFEKLICHIYGTKLSYIKSKTRKQGIIIARKLCMWYLKNYTKTTLKKIGFRYGQKNHATVLSAIRSINNIIDTKDKKFYPNIELFIKTIENEKRKTIDCREIIN